MRGAIYTAATLGLLLLLELPESAPAQEDAHAPFGSEQAVTIFRGGHSPATTVFSAGPAEAFSMGAAAGAIVSTILERIEAMSDPSGATR